MLDLDGNQADAEAEKSCMLWTASWLADSTGEGLKGDVLYCVSSTEGGWCLNPRREDVPQEDNWNQVTLPAQQFTQVDNSRSVEYTGRLAIQLVCPSMYMSFCVLLSLRLFTSLPGREEATKLLCCWQAGRLPPSVEGQLCLAAVCWKDMKTCLHPQCVLLLV